MTDMVMQVERDFDLVHNDSDFDLMAQHIGLRVI